MKAITRRLRITTVCKSGRTTRMLKTRITEALSGYTATHGRALADL
jgi:hypothetical protein